MRIKPVITTVFGIAIAAGSVFVANNSLLNVNGTDGASNQSELVEIYLARSEIAFGQTIERHLVTVHSWPREALPPGAFSDIAMLVPENPEQLRRAKGRFYPGEVLIASKVSNFGEKVTLVQKLGENTRAMAIKVDAVTAVGGFVTPGDFVDIVLTQGSNLELRAVTILQKIRVIGVDQQSEELNEQPEVARTITVEVTPEQGQRLALAQKAGTLSLTLRTLDGVEDKPLEMVRLRDLLQEESPVEKSEIQPTVRVRRGTDSEIVVIRRSAPSSDAAVEQEVADPAQKRDPVIDPNQPLESSKSTSEPADTQADVASVLTSDALGQ